MKQLIERNMVWMVLLLTLCVKGYDYLFPSGSWDLNRSIGWSWDIKNAIWHMIFSSNVIFLVGYALTKIFKRYHLFSFSVVHLLVIFVLSVWPLSSMHSMAIINRLQIVSVSIFLINILTSKPIVPKEDIIPNLLDDDAFQG